MKRTFRTLIGLNWATAIGLVIVSLTTKKFLPSELTPYLESRRHAAISNFNMALALVEVILLLVCVIDAVGLFLFRKWARTLLVPLYVMGILLYPTNPVYLETGWTKMTVTVCNILGGMILALAYFSPVSTLFDRDHAD
jgi:hypothetical protein